MKRKWILGSIVKLCVLKRCWKVKISVEYLNVRRTSLGSDFIILSSKQELKNDFKNFQEIKTILFLNLFRKRIP